MTTFTEYFFYLMHRIFKRGPRSNSDADKLAKSLGPDYDAAMESLFMLREQALVITATGKALDQLGKDGGLARYRDEDDEAYRRRLLAAFSIHTQVGTKAAMLAAFHILGFMGADIDELRAEDPNRWAEFRVVLSLPAAIFSEADRSNILATIRKMKPAHTKLAELNLEAPSDDVTGAEEDKALWNEQVNHSLFACPLPSENLYPSEDLYPC